MAINFTRLFTALGKIIASVNSENTYRGTTLPARVAVLDGQYVSPNQALITNLYPAEDTAQASGDGWLAYLQQLAVVTAIQEVDLDRPMVNPTLPAALASIASGLRAASQTVTEAPAVCADTPTLTVGDAQLVFEAGVNPSDLYNPDTYLVNVVSDQTTGSTPFSEFVSVVGKANVPALNFLWPTGSGVNSGLTATNSANDTLISSDFSTWTATGAVVATTGGPRTGVIPYNVPAAASMKYELPTVAPGSYAWTWFYYGAGAGCDVYLEIVDSADNVVTVLDFVTDAAAAWVQASGVWNFTTQPPFTYAEGPLYLRIRTDGVGPAKFALPGFDSATPLYAGGPVMYLWSGTTPLGLPDYWTATVTRASSETVGLYRGMVRLFDLPSLSPQITIPTGNPGTFQNSLVV